MRRKLDEDMGGNVNSDNELIDLTDDTKSDVLLRVSMSNDSQGNILERRKRLGYLTSCLLGEVEE